MSLTIEKFEALLDKKFSEFEAPALTSIRESIDSVKASLHFLSSQYDDLSKSVNDLSEKQSATSWERESSFTAAEYDEQYQPAEGRPKRLRAIFKAWMPWD